MSPKKTSDAGDEPIGADPSPDKSIDASADAAPATSADAVDEGPESVLLPGVAQASESIEAREASADEASSSAEASADEASSNEASSSNEEAGSKDADAKNLGSRTLMGIGLEAFRPTTTSAATDDSNDGVAAPSGSQQEEADGVSAKSSDDDSDDASDVSPEDLTPTVIRPDLAAAARNEDTQVTSLLDEVAQALNLQASEHRDRALGKLPGLTASTSNRTRAPSPGPVRAGMALTDGAEFEDPDDGPTSLTPGILSDADVHETSDDLELTATGEDQDDAVVLGLVGANKSAGADGRLGKLPPIPGLSGPVSSLVGPPPGAARAQTPASGLTPTPASGRVRMPSPAPGVPSIPPPSGRLSLPPGLVSTPVIPSPQQSQIVLSAPVGAVLGDSSRRVSNLLTRRSGRTDKSGSVRLTPSGLSGAAALPAMPAVLAAQVKIATVSLAGLVAVTFAGGLLVGMLVWRGSGRSESPRVAGSVEPASFAPVAKAPAIVPVPPAERVQPTVVTTVPTVAVLPTNAVPAAAGAVPVRAAAPNGATTEAIVTPIAAVAAAAADAPPTDAKPVARRAVASRQPPRVRRPPTEADAEAQAAPPVAAAAPKPAPVAPAAAPPAAPKAVASNAPAPKPVAPKAKPKTTWHDPFAD